jgi:23S rRNA (cytidine1920-2'-O)/16S rRNA (cytidine1409-2'-O)-methyltransferase
MSRRRLDRELVRRGLAPDVGRAADLVAAGRVTVGGAPTETPGRLVDAGDAVIVVPEPDRYVGRGGHKLEAALEHFHIDVRGRRALDAGASTGGFTDCLLQRGAVEVIAVDVGHGQLHERLRSDSRVVVRERLNIRGISLADVGDAVDVAVADLSFISLSKVVAPIAGVCVAGAPFVALVKPQFEAERDEVSRGRGVISDPEIWRRVLDEAMSALRAGGASIMGAMVSPLRGAEGNVEFLVHSRFGVAAGDGASIDLDELVATARAR